MEHIQTDTEDQWVEHIQTDTEDQWVEHIQTDTEGKTIATKERVGHSVLIDSAVPHSVHSAGLIDSAVPHSVHSADLIDSAVPHSVHSAGLIDSAVHHSVHSADLILAGLIPAGGLALCWQEAAIGKNWKWSGFCVLLLFCCCFLALENFSVQNKSGHGS